MLCGHGVAIIVLSGDGPFDVDLVDTFLFDNDMVSTLLSSDGSFDRPLFGGSSSSIPLIVKVIKGSRSK